MDGGCGERGVKDRGGGLGARPVGWVVCGAGGKVFLEWLAWGEAALRAEPDECIWGCLWGGSWYCGSGR